MGGHESVEGGHRTRSYPDLMDPDALDGFETGPARDDDLDDVVRMMESADRALGIPAEPVR